MPLMRRAPRHRLTGLLLAFVLVSAVWPLPAVGGDAVRFEELATVSLPASAGDGVAAEICWVNYDSPGDLAVITQSPARLLVYRGNGIGGFTHTEDLGLSAQPTSLCIADFDGDFKADYAVGDVNADVTLYYGDGAGGVDTGKASSVAYLGTASLTDLDVGFLNSDHLPDIVAAEAPIGTVHAVLNSSGALGSHSSYAVGSLPVRVAVGHVDTAAGPDIAAIDQWNGGVHILSNNGSGTFAPVAGSPFATGSNPQDVQLLNLNGDSRRDIVVSSFPGDEVNVYVSGAGNSWLARQDYATGDGPGFVVGLPVDSRGETVDIAVECRNAGALSFLRNDGAGALAAGGSTALAGSLGIVSDDLTRDFKHDIAAVRAGDVKVLRNSTPPETRRYAGADRYATAVEISKRSPSGTTELVIATGEAFPDALAGTPLAAAHRVPLLLTRRDGLPTEVYEEVKRLQPTTVFVLGGTAAVSADVVADLIAAGVPASGIERLGGADRYETSYKIAMAVQDARGWTDVQTAVVATGDDYPDAVVGGAFAGGVYGPIVLVRRDAVPAASKRIFDDLPSLTRTFVLGGPAVISDNVKNGFPSPVRLAGPDRYTTAASVADQVFEEQLAEGTRGPMSLSLATGEDFPDALALGPLAAAGEGPVLLTQSDKLPAATRAFFARRARDVELVWVAGGESAISSDVIAELESVY
jgi:putative cell wall-binding protein